MSSYGDPTDLVELTRRMHEMEMLQNRGKVLGTLEMLCARLFGGDTRRELPFEFAKAHRSSETVYLFIVSGGKDITLKDEAGLFPSDKLITSVRLLLDDAPKASSSDHAADTMAYARTMDQLTRLTAMREKEVAKDKIKIGKQARMRFLRDGL